jgi:hypothetical protein
MGSLGHRAWTLKVRTDGLVRKGSIPLSLRLVLDGLLIPGRGN